VSEGKVSLWTDGGKVRLSLGKRKLTAAKTQREYAHPTSPAS
jgi:hypothetical protein